MALLFFPDVLVTEGITVRLLRGNTRGKPLNVAGCNEGSLQFVKKGQVKSCRNHFLVPSNM